MCWEPEFLNCLTNRRINIFYDMDRDDSVGAIREDFFNQKPTCHLNFYFDFFTIGRKNVFV